MRYTKPAVLSCTTASKSIMGLAKVLPVADNAVGTPTLCTASAYESDE
jgi:hypothetical protein